MQVSVAQQRRVSTSSNAPSSQPQQKPAYTLPGVLHFLQANARRYELDRNNWEIQKIELQGRIALLEGERKSMDNIKNDLLRRVKMLEFALRQERNKHAAKINETYDQQENGDVDGAPLNVDATLDLLGKPDEVKSNASFAHLRPSHHSSMRESKIRTSRGKDLLRSCLQEINHLSELATAPLIIPHHQRSEDDTSASRDSLSSAPTSRFETREIQIHKKIQVLKKDSGKSKTKHHRSDVTDVSTFSNDDKYDSGMTSTPISNGEASQNDESSGAFDEMISTVAARIYENPSAGRIARKVTEAADDLGVVAGDVPEERIAEYDGAETETFVGNLTRKRTVLKPHKDKAPQADTQGRESKSRNTSPSKSKRVRKKPENASQESTSSASSSKSKISVQELDELARLTLDDPEERSEPKSENINGEGGHKKLWKAKFTLRSHLDTVRSVAFHQSEAFALSGGDDCTVKLWNLKNIGQSKKGVPPDAEPVMTYRGHTAAITAVAICASQRKCYSASIDSTIRAWWLPSKDRELYSPYDPTLAVCSYVGHTDAIWDIRLQEDVLRTPAGGGAGRLMASASADGTVKIWETEIGDVSGGALRGSFSYREDKDDGPIRSEDAIVPTAIDFCSTDATLLAVAYSNSALRLVNVESGQVVMEFDSAETYDGTVATQINCVVAHPTLPMIVTGHDDRYIRTFDMDTGQCTHSMLAHLGSIASLDIDPAGLVLVSGGHDSSIRLWDLLSPSKPCIQEFTSHRKKGDEGVCCVRYHPALPWLASGGGDSVVKISASR